jgi:hypothetical protein
VATKTQRKKAPARGGRRFGLTPDGESVRVDVRWPPDLLAWIDSIAAADDWTRADVIRNCVSAARYDEAATRVRFDAERDAWVHAEAKRRGCMADDVLRALVDEARATRP